jgi:MFS family permease
LHVHLVFPVHTGQAVRVESDIMSSTTTTEVIELHPFPAMASPNASAHKNTFEPLNRETSSSHNVLEEASVPVPSDERTLSNLQLVMTILQPSTINFFASYASGIITVGLPAIASSLTLERSLYLWPSSVYSLTSGAALLISGAVTDIIGARHVEVFGISLLGIFILACGFAHTGIQLVVFRALQGIALAMHIPASVSIIATAVPAGRSRNIGFGCLGLSLPLGYSFGMVTSGIMIEKIGWQSGFYLSGGVILLAAALSWLTLPKVKGAAESLKAGPLITKLWKEVDWVGGSIASSGLALLSYVLA